MEGTRINVTSLLVGAAAGCAVGALFGHILANRKFAARLDEEVASLKHHYQVRAEVARDRADALERSVPALADWLGQPGVSVGFRDSLHENDDVTWIHPDNLVVRQDQASEPVEASVIDSEPELPESLDGDNASWPPANRDRSRPYVISDEEFAEGPEDNVHRCISIKWYDADKVLVDDRDQPITDVLRTTGRISKKSFGGVSGDEYIMYVRNEKLEVDFEIAFDERSYTEAVLNYGNPNPGNTR